MECSWRGEGKGEWFLCLECLGVALKRRSSSVLPFSFLIDKSKPEVNIRLALWAHVGHVNPECGYCFLQFEDEVSILVPCYSIEGFGGSFCFCSEVEQVLFLFDWTCILS